MSQQPRDDEGRFQPTLPPVADRRAKERVHSAGTGGTIVGML